MPGAVPARSPAGRNSRRPAHAAPAPAQKSSGCRRRVGGKGRLSSSHRHPLPARIPEEKGSGSPPPDLVGEHRARRKEARNHRREGSTDGGSSRTRRGLAQEAMTWGSRSPASEDTHLRLRRGAPRAGTPTPRREALRPVGTLGAQSRGKAPQFRLQSASMAKKTAGLASSGLPGAIERGSPSQAPGLCTGFFPSFRKVPVRQVVTEHRKISRSQSLTQATVVEREKESKL